MYLSKKHLPRRTVLKGLGATLALPFLDAMVPAFASNATRGQRLGFIYFPHGAIMDQWTPDTEGKGFEFKPILKSLEPFRDRLSIVSQLHHRAADTSAVHSLSPTTWLSGVRPRPTQGIDAYAGVTADQIAAQAIGQDTPLPSMELAVEDHSGLIGACDRDYGCIYMNTLSWRTPTTPLPMEINPRKVFEIMFGQGASAEQRIARRAEDRSILDALGVKTSELRASVGTRDRETLDQYLEGVREIERRLQQAESQAELNPDLVIPEAPSGIPFDYESHVAIMFDLLALAFQADITRVWTFMMAREVSNRTYPQAGVPEGHHATSHHMNRPDRMQLNAQIQHYHVGLFARFLERLDATPDGDGSLLDNSILLYGSNMSNSNAHDHYPLPNVVVGGGRGALNGGLHVRCEDNTPMANLLVTLLNKAGVEIDSLGDSDGTIAQI
jgi:hypothetical protein